MREGREPLAADLDLQLLALIDVFRRSPARLLNNGHPSRRVVREASLHVLGEACEPPEDGWMGGGRLPFLYHLARALGLLGRDGDHLRVDGARSGKYFLAPAPDRTRQRVRAFRHARTWTETLDLPEIEIDGGARARGQGAPDVERSVVARGVVFDAVARLPVGGPISLRAFSERVRAETPTLLFDAETGPYYPGVFRRRGAVLRVARRDGWPDVEGRFIRRVLDTLASLGCVMFGVPGRTGTPMPGTEGDDLFHITTAGRYALDTGPRPDERALTGGELVVQPTFEVVVVARRPDVSLVFDLERFATRTGHRPGTTYQIEEASVYRAVREGMAIADIVEFLHCHGQQPPPPAVLFALEDWGRRQERVKVWRRSALLEFPDAATLDNDLISLDLKAAGARRIGDRWVLVPEGDRRAVTRCLGQNYLTDLDYAGELPPCVVAGADGTLEVRPETARLDVEARLDRFAARTGDGRWRITADELRRAESQGLSAGRIVDCLDELVDGGVPAALRVLIDAAGGDIGRVGLGDVVALVTERPGDAERLAELPELAPHVVRLLPGGVALLRPEGREAVRAALRGLGVVEDEAVLHRRAAAAQAAPGSPGNGTRGANGHTPLPASAPGSAATLAVPAAPVQTAAQMKHLLSQAASDGREAVIRYDPGARRPLQDLRVAPVRVESRNGAAYLLARQRGRSAARKFSLKFVQGVRLLGADP